MKRGNISVPVVMKDTRSMVNQHRDKGRKGKMISRERMKVHVSANHPLKEGALHDLITEIVVNVWRGASAVALVNAVGGPPPLVKTDHGLVSVEMEDTLPQVVAVRDLGGLAGLCQHLVLVLVLLPDGTVMRRVIADFDNRFLPLRPTNMKDLARTSTHEGGEDPGIILDQVHDQWKHIRDLWEQSQLDQWGRVQVAQVVLVLTTVHLTPHHPGEGRPCYQLPLFPRMKILQFIHLVTVDLQEITIHHMMAHHPMKVDGAGESLWGRAL